MNTSVVSAAILEGKLILGLSDGSVIDCGYVQGPPGLKGDPGIPGPPGDPGTDGSTIHTIAGTPRNDMGRDGDYAIDNINWRIYGPKSGGVWGNANEMLPSKENLIVNGRGFEGGAGGSGDTNSGGSGDLKSIIGAEGIIATPQPNPQIVQIDADIDPAQGLYFSTEKIAINISAGLAFDALTGALQTDFDISDYATTDYVDAGDANLQNQIDALIPEIEQEPAIANRLYRFKTSGFLSNGDVVSTITTPADVTELAFATLDISGQNTPSASVGDTITLNTPDDSYTYTVTDSAEISNGLNFNVTFTEGSTVPFTEGTRYTATFAIYPANLTTRILQGEKTQRQIETTITGALETQAQIIEDVDVLQVKVEALEGTVIDGKWALDNRAAARPGYFLLFNGVVAATTWADTTVLQVYPEDQDGRIYTFDEVGIDDVIRIGGAGGSAAFKITGPKTPSGDVFNFDVTLLNSTGAPFETIVYDFEFLNAFDPSAYATKQYVDDKDDLDVKLAAVNNVTTSFRIKSGNNTLISTGTEGELGLYHVKDPSNQSDGWAANKGYVDTQGALKVDKAGDSYLGYLDFNGSPSGIRFFRDGEKLFSVWNKEANEIRLRVQPNKSFNLTGYVGSSTTEESLVYWDSQSLYLYKLADPLSDDSALNLGYADGRYVAKTGDTITGDIDFDGANRSITAVNGNRLRIKGKDASGGGRTFIDIQKADSTGAEGFDAGYRVRIYHLGDPSDPYHASNKKYVDEQVASVGGNGVPVGSIMIWMNSDAPAGWFKLQGGTFDTTANPLLHAYLQKTNAYVPGVLPNWSGRYPGEYGDHLSGTLGVFANAKTAQPSGGAPRSSNSIPNGNTRTFGAAGGTNAYSDGASRVTIDSGWDSTTRPKTVVVHYIIKHD